MHILYPGANEHSPWGCCIFFFLTVYVKFIIVIKYTVLYQMHGIYDHLFGTVISMSDCHPRVLGSIPGYTLEIFLEV